MPLPTPRPTGQDARTPRELRLRREARLLNTYRMQVHAGLVSTTRADGRRWVQRGWTAAGYRAAVEDAAAWVLKQHVPLAHLMQQQARADWFGRTDVDLTRDFLAGIVESLMCVPDQTADQALAWMRALAGSMTEAQALADLRDTSGIRPLVAEWSGLGALGPLAYAAGLSLPEAKQRQAEGTLTPEGLALLAALRC